jgi:hypothetical protein
MRDHIMNIDPSSPYHSSRSSQRSVLVNTDTEMSPESAMGVERSKNMVESVLPAVSKISVVAAGATA